MGSRNGVEGGRRLGNTKKPVKYIQNGFRDPLNPSSPKMFLKLRNLVKKLVTKVTVTLQKKVFKCRLETALKD